MPPELGDKLYDSKKNLSYEVTNVTMYGVSLTEIPKQQEPVPDTVPVTLVGDEPTAQGPGFENRDNDGELKGTSQIDSTESQ